MDLRWSLILILALTRLSVAGAQPIPVLQPTNAIGIHPIALSINCHDTEKIQIKKSINSETIYEILDAYKQPHGLRYADDKCSNKDFEPSAGAASTYTESKCNGFWILIQDRVFKHPALAAHGYQVLCEKLIQAQELLSHGQFERIHNTPFWMEWDVLWNGSRYHPYIDWLNDNHANPEKLFGVEITNLRNFITALENQEPLLVMHELAHAYHDQVLGNEFPPIHNAFAQAKSEGLYESVEVVGGEIDIGYAITDEQEYFAELTESYFGQSEYFPFTKKELQSYDPLGFAILRKIWQ